MGEVSFVHPAASIGFGRDDVIFCVREVEPVFRAVVEFEADLGPPIALRDAVANPHIVKLAFVVDRRVKRITSQSTERSGLAVGAQAIPVGAGKQIETSQFLLQDYTIQIDRAQVR